MCTNYQKTVFVQRCNKQPSQPTITTLKDNREGRVATRLNGKSRLDRDGSTQSGERNHVKSLLLLSTPLLLGRLQRRYGLTGVVLCWVESYLRDSKQSLLCAADRRYNM